MLRQFPEHLGRQEGGCNVQQPVANAKGIVAHQVTELLGNPVLESQLAAAVARGVRVRLIAPIAVNGGGPDVQELQLASLVALASVGVEVHVSGPGESADHPYMHARAAVVDGEVAYLGSISLSPDALAFNREMGTIIREAAVVHRLAAQFESDFRLRTRGL